MKKLLLFTLLLIGTFPSFAEEKPLLKVVVTTDIHAQWQLLEQVYAFMAEKNPDAVLFAGDLARYVGDAKSYKTYISIYNKHFSKCKPAPVHIPITGNHDYWEYKGKKRLAPQDSLKRFFHSMGMEANWLQHHVIKGYTFIGISATDEKGENNHTDAEIKQVSDLIGQAEKQAPGKPVFVMTHCPPAFTMTASAWHEDPRKVWDWRYDHIRRMLKGHKQVISLSGHTHMPLQDERTIWQGEFTAINVGGLYKTSVIVPGADNNHYLQYNGSMGQSFCYIEVFNDYMLIYRYNAKTLKEIDPENRWRVELPYDPAKAVYTKNRSTTKQSPEFPADAKAEIIKENNIYCLRLNPAKHPEFVHSYKVKLTFDDKNLKPAQFFVVSDFFDPQKAQSIVLPLPKKLKLTSGSSGKISIAPVETFGKTGKTLTVSFTVPQ